MEDGLERTHEYRSVNAYVLCVQGLKSAFAIFDAHRSSQCRAAKTTPS